MSKSKFIHPRNSEGSFSVNNHCLRCTWCQVMEPNFFEVDRDRSFVKKQPVCQAEIEACQKVLAGCPAKAIKKE